MEFCKHNWATISETICRQMLIFGKQASWTLFFQNILTNPIISEISFLWRHTLVLYWPIEQCLLHIRVFFGGKTKRPCFDLYIYWLTKQIITNTYWNHFSRSYENRSIDRANTNMSNRGRRGTRIVVISPQSPATGRLYCLVSHWNYDKPVEYFRLLFHYYVILPYKV